jgi:hypothetical protein
LVDFDYQFPVRHRRHFAMSALLHLAFLSRSWYDMIYYNIDIFKNQCQL